MRLSRAVGVMLLLHVVAVGGVLAFGMIKERPTGAGNDRPAKAPRNGQRIVPTETVVAPDNAPTPFPSTPSVPAPTPPRATTNGRVAPAPALSRVETDAVRLIESGGPNPLVTNGERAYVVGRGETVQTIAQKLRVEAATLLRLNNIDDPRKIQAGQRLRVPPAAGRSRS